MLNKKVIIDSLRNLSKPTKMSNKNSFDFKEGGSKKEGFISAQEGVETPIYKAVKVGASPIEGKGLFADQAIRKGDVIGVSHIRKKFMKDGDEYQAPFPSTVLGYYNHSEEPNVYEVDNGDHIVMVAGRDIQRGQELTSNYNKHNIEDLEVPEDFKKGGATKRPSLPSKKSPRSYSRSFEATNRFFAQHPLFKKPKSKKNKIFDPNSEYYANGGVKKVDPNLECDDEGRCYETDQIQAIYDKADDIPKAVSRFEWDLENELWTDPKTGNRRDYIALGKPGQDARELWKRYGINNFVRPSCMYVAGLGWRCAPETKDYMSNFNPVHFNSNIGFINAVDKGDLPFVRVGKFSESNFDDPKKGNLKVGDIVNFKGADNSHAMTFMGHDENNKSIWFDSNGHPAHIGLHEAWKDILPNNTGKGPDYAYVNRFDKERYIREAYGDQIKALEEKARINPTPINTELSESQIQEYLRGGLVQYAPGGLADEPPGSKKKPPKDPNRILPKWMPEGMVKAIQNTEVGVSPFMTNEQAYPIGMKKTFTDMAATGEMSGEGTGPMGISNPSYGVNFTTGLTRDVSKNKDTGWALKGYLGRPYDSSLGQAAGAAIERMGQDTYDARWNQYYEDLADYNAGTMAPSMLWNGDGKGWDPEKSKPKYDGKLARGLGRAMQKSPLIGGLSAHYRYDKFKQPHGYKAAGEGEIKLDWDPSNNVGLGLKGGLEFYGGNKYHTKNYRPGAYKWNVNPSVTGGIGTRPHFGFNLNAGLEGLPKFMPKNFPGYFYGNVNYNQSLLGPGSLSANAGMKFPLNDLKQRRAKSRVKEKEEEDRIIPNTTSPGGVRTTTFSSQKDGGFIIDLADEDIQKYVDGGYIVEELPKASRGREKKTYVAPKLNEVQFKPVEIQTYNPKLKEYQIHMAELPDRIVPGREYADVKHKMGNLRKDLGISGFDHLINKYIPGAAHPISLVKDSGIVIDPATGKLFDSNTRYWLNREYGFEPSIDQFFEQMSDTLAKDYGKLIMSSDTPFQNRKMGINYMDEFASPYAQKNGLLNLFGEPTGGGSLMIGMGMMGKPEFTKEIKNPDYFNQLLDSYTTKQLSSSSKKFYKDLINSVKNQNGLVTERQYNELQRLKTGNFDFGKKGYADGGLVKAARGLPVKNAKNLGRRANIATVGTANTLAKTFAPVMMNPARIPMFGARVENMGPFTGSPLNALPFYGKKIMPESNTAFRKFGDSLDYVKLSGELNPVHGPLIRMGKDQIASEGNWAALNQPNEWYPGVMAAKFDFNAPGTNLGFTKIPQRDGVLITDAQGNRMPAIPISDPGLSFQRRLPFSNRYVDVNMNKLRNDQFDISTVGTNTQALLERYGYGMGYAALLGAMGLSAPQEIIDDYINKPLIEGFNKTRDFLQPLDDKAKELLIDPFIKEEGGEIDYELGQEVDEETKRKLEALGYTFEIVK